MSVGLKKILIVEDEAVLGQMYKEKFESSGFSADLVISAEDALEYLKTKKPGIVLLDILLPQKSGIDFLRELKKSNKNKNLLIVAFSNYDDPNTKKEAAELGIKEYLLKTQFTPTELVEKIKFLAERDIN